MRLRFSRTADYGLRATLEVARAKGQLVPRRELSRVTGAPLSVLAQPLAALARADVLDAQAGPRGGYRLARPARDISVYDVVLAIDGEGRPERCVLHEGVCSWEGACPFHAVLATAQERFTDTLRSTSLEDVLTETPLPTR
jgi:Rrf2 family iron-sulfur cluster assembly transcriptional regulator